MQRLILDKIKPVWVTAQRALQSASFPMGCNKRQWYEFDASRLIRAIGSEGLLGATGVSVFYHPDYVAPQTTTVLRCISIETAGLCPCLICDDTQDDLVIMDVNSLNGEPRVPDAKFGSFDRFGKSEWRVKSSNFVIGPDFIRNYKVDHTAAQILWDLIFSQPMYDAMCNACQKLIGADCLFTPSEYGKQVLISELDSTECVSYGHQKSKLAFMREVGKDTFCFSFQGHSPVFGGRK